MAGVGREARLFYDGGCALCHGAVRFVLKRDTGQPPMRIAPLDGATAQRLLPEGGSGLPDSVVVLTPQGELLMRWRAVRHLLGRSGWLERLAAALMALVPVRLGDALYEAVARRRRRWFGTTTEACPLLPDHLRSRFDP